MKITQRQAKYLRDRLEEIRKSKPSYHQEVQANEPARVTAAKKLIEHNTEIVEVWEKSLSERKRKRNLEIGDIANKCRRIIEFGESEAALKALDEFAAKDFQ